MRKARWLLALPALVLVAGCGSTSPGAAGSGASGGTAIDVQEYMFTPATITAKAGDKVTVTITNKGQYEHNFSISELSVSQDVDKGESKTVTFTATASTNLQFFCKYHKDRGMTGIVDLGGGNMPAASPGGGGASPSSDKTYGSTY